MTKNKIVLTPQDWQDIMNVPEVKDNENFDEDLTPEEFAAAYSAFKFKLPELGPDYELYVIHEEYNSDNIEFFFREGGQLRLLA